MNKEDKKISSESNTKANYQKESKEDLKEKIRLQLLSASISDKNANGETLLHAAFKANCFDAIRLALKNLTGNFNPANKEDIIHFHIACVLHEHEAAEQFLKSRFDPNSRISLDSAEFFDLTPVEFAILNDCFELFVILVKYKADLSRKNAKGQSPLHMIYHSNRLRNRKAWIEQAFKHGNDSKFVKCTDNYKVSHLHLCCMQDKSHFIKRCIDFGADVNDSTSSTCPLNPGFTALHFAVVNGCLRVIETLLMYGADPNKTDTAGKTPLHLAAELCGKNTPNQVFVHVAMALYRCRANPMIADANGATALHASFYSSKNETCTLVDLLTLKLGCNWGTPNHTDEHGLSLFHIACAKTVFEVVQNFLNSGVDVRSRVHSGAYSGYTALHFAVMYDFHEQLLQLLLEKGADVNAQEDTSGFTPLHLACNNPYRFCKIGMIQTLIEHKASPVIPDKMGHMPLHESFYNASRKDFTVFEALVSKVNWGSENCIDKHGLSLFHIICATNQVDQVLKFLDSGVDIDSYVTSGIFEGFTALHFAIMFDQKDIIDILLKKNANVNVKYTCTPLHLACEFNYKTLDEGKLFRNPVDIVKLLISQGANVEAKDSNGITPLLHVCMIDKNYNQVKWTSIIEIYQIDADTRRLQNGISAGLQEIIEVLISNKANVNARTNNGSTILHILSVYRNLKVSETLIDFLVTSGADINAITFHSGYTPLRVAVQNDNIDMIRNLLKNNANPNIKCRISRIPLHIIVEKIIHNYNLFLTEGIKNKEIFFALLESGSMVNIRNEHDGILLHNAIQNRNGFLVQNLLKYGADINMDDSVGNCSISYPLVPRPFTNWWRILKIIFFHIKWLEAAKQPISQKVQHFRYQLYLHYRRQVEKFAESIDQNENSRKCHAELDAMKKVKIDSYTSLYDILVKTPHELISSVKNADLIKIAKDKSTCNKFPLYGYLLKRQIEKGLKRKDISLFADIALRSLLNINLPDLCCDLILKCLTNEEVANLQISAPIKQNLIRKLSDNLSENEIVNKLRKTETC